MIIDKDFYFEIGLSVNNYMSKEETKLCLSTIGAKSANMDKLAFYNHTTLSIDEFEYYTTNGYCFCNLFKYDANKKYYKENTNPKYPFKFTYEYPEYKKGNNKGAMKLTFKCDDYFEGSQCVFVDVDKTSFETLNDYVDVLTFKPTFSYCTYSDKIKGTRKFRLCYIFENILDEYQFYSVSKAIHSSIVEDTNEEMDDDCGTRESQYFNGTQNKEETYRSNFIYSYSDFIVSNNNNNININQSTSSSNSLTTTTTITTIYPDWQNEGQFTTTTIEDYEVEEIVIVKPELDMNFVSDMERLDYEEFMHYYSKQYKFYWRLESEDWIEGKFQYVDEDYFRLYFNVERLKDGMCRRKKLYQRMCLRRVLNPEATPNEILFNAYMDLHRFIDNTEDVITIQDLVRNVKSCFKFEVSEIIEKFDGLIKLAKEHTQPKNGKIYKNKTVIKSANQLEISLYYNPSLTPKQNLEVLKQNGVNVSLSTLYRYCRDNNINTSITDDEILSLLDLNLSVRKNKVMLEDNYNIHISKNRINKIITTASTSTTIYSD